VLENDFGMEIETDGVLSGGLWQDYYSSRREGATLKASSSYS